MTEVKQHILLVEDDHRLATLIKDYLQKQGFSVMIEDRGDTAQARIVDENPDLVVLDLMLPGKDGLSVCHGVRPTYAGPILILTAKEDDMDQVAGLEMGADDYVKKPIKPRVLLARIRALLRRFEKTTRSDNPSDIRAPSESMVDELVFGELQIYRASQSIRLNGRPVELTTHEFELLWFLASNGGKVLDRDTLYSTLRGIEFDGLDRSVDLRISHLRKKLEDDATHPQRIKTVWGQGYLFVKDAW
jgi:DNA-binding response OmpR family regulator